MKPCEMHLNPNSFKIPSPKDTVRLQGLASAADLNGAMGVIVRYAPEQDRYQVKLTSVDRKGTLAVKMENIVVVDAVKRSSSLSMHILIPCHLMEEHRLLQFGQCMKSVAKQTDTDCCAFVGISSPLAGLRYFAVALLRVVNDKRPGVRWYFVDNDSEATAQFEHFRDLLPISDAINKDAWLMFLDNDDMFHPRRVELFRSEAGRRHPLDPDRVAFYSGNKLLLNSDMIGYNKVELDEFVLDGGKSEPWPEDEALQQVTQLAVGASNVELLGANEYFDYCVRASFVRRFMELKPAQMLSNKYCDCRFMASVARECTTMFSSREHMWLIIHFKVPAETKTEAFWDADKERHERHASASIDVAKEEDRSLAEHTGLPPEQIVACRNELEEQAIMFFARDDRNLEGARHRFENEINKNVGHNIGSILWEQTCEKFASYFSEDLNKRNREGFEKGRAPWALLNFEDRDDLY
jgi:hypothetical protein